MQEQDRINLICALKNLSESIVMMHYTEIYLSNVGDSFSDKLHNIIDELKSKENQIRKDLE